MKKLLIAALAGAMVASTGAVAQDMPAAPDNGGKWPVCSRTVTDNCQQPRAAGKHYGDMPSNHRHGRPAHKWQYRGHHKHWRMKRDHKDGVPMHKTKGPDGTAKPASM